MRKTRILLAIVSAVVLAAVHSHAAAITWSLPQNISGDSDVSTSGTLFQAANVGDGSVPSTTVNGVTFSPFVMSGTNVASGNFQLNGEFTLFGYSGYGAAAAPFNTLSSAYQDLLSYGNYTSGNAVMTLTISGLTVGHTYEFQWWANDSSNAYPEIEHATAGNTVTLDGDTTDAVGGTGQFAIGTFVADATTQTIDFDADSGSYTLQNAYQLRDLNAVPEPASASLLILGAVALAHRRRRK